ncbi:MAG: hypothetical protein HKN80_00060 [Acidimicrobiia bacterium]|nr:hypothetical protein [Acidimicrobiia bacterium]
MRTPCRVVRHGAPRPSDTGSVGLVLLAVAAVTLTLSLAMVAVGQYLVGYAQAQAAADAAALAAAPVTFSPFGATGSARQEAAIFATANGAELLGCHCPSDPSWEPRTVEVTVRRSFRVVLFGAQSVEAVSRAEFIPARLLD